MTLDGSAVALQSLCRPLRPAPCCVKIISNYGKNLIKHFAMILPILGFCRLLLLGRGIAAKGNGACSVTVNQV